LTFNIVFAPFLDFYKFPNDAIEYRDENGDYRFTFKPDETAIEFYDKQLDQENRRLIYVAMTRAVYKTYLCNNISPKYKTTGELRDFLKFYGDEESKSGFAQWLEFNPETEAVQDDFQLEISRETAKPRTVVGIPEFRKSWDIHSFSSLNHKHEYVSADLIDIDDEYDNFVFNVMPKGAKAGLFLHSIFENLDFANPYDYREVLEKSGAFYSSIYRDEHADNYLKLVNHCLGVKISNMDGEDFSLNEVINDKKLPEMEFFFSIDRHQKSQITRLIPEIEFTTDPEIEGLIHGFIDLFFEHNGKYYIIDWKSNFLGNRLEDYNQEGLVAGMKGSNYYLQYYLYTIAVKRYLSHKLPNFDYERDFGGAIYVFLRGVRKNDNSTGIYFDRPLKERIEALELVFGP